MFSNLTKTHFNAIWVSILCTLILPLWLYGQNACKDFYSGREAFNAWDFESLANDKSLKPEHFLPKSYLEKLAANGEEVYLEVQKQNKSYLKPEKIFFSLIASGIKEKVLEFALQKGNKPGQIIVEDFATQDPLSTKDLGKKTRYRNGNRGLPQDSFYYFLSSLYSLLKAGGYNQIEIQSSQNLLVYFLYHNIVGAKPDNPNGENLAKYLRDLIRLAMRKQLLGDEVRTVGDLAQFMGDGSTPPKRTLMTITWSLITNKDVATKYLEKLGAEPILNGSGEIVGFKRGEEVMFILRFLPKQPILDWNRIHEYCPECIRLIKNF